MSQILCKSVLHQIEFAIQSIVEMTYLLKEEDLQKKPTPGKHSIGELLEHLAVICEADWRISNEASEEEMRRFYSEMSYPTLEELRRGLTTHFDSLKKNYLALSDEELMAATTSHWGLTYTRYEWLLEIMAHIYHHRGQLHAILVHCYGMDPRIPLFE